MRLLLRVRQHCYQKKLSFCLCFLMKVGGKDSGENNSLLRVFHKTNPCIFLEIISTIRTRDYQITIAEICLPLINVRKRIFLLKDLWLLLLSLGLGNSRTRLFTVHLVSVELIPFVSLRQDWSPSLHFELKDSGAHRECSFLHFWGSAAKTVFPKVNSALKGRGV